MQTPPASPAPVPAAARPSRPRDVRAVLVADDVIARPTAPAVRPPSPDAREATRRGLAHLYHGDITDRVARYSVREGALPAGLSGRALFTVFPYEAVFNDATLASKPHMLTAPGRLLAIDLDAARDGTLRLETRFLDVPSWHLRKFAPGAVTRTDFAELGWLGLMDLANTTPVPTFPVAHPDGRRGRRLVVSYDAGRPSEVDPARLAHVAPVGAAERYLPAVNSSFSPMILTSGHPVYDPDFDDARDDDARGRLIYTHLVPRALDFARQRRVRADLYMMAWDGESAPSRPVRVCVDGRPVVLEQASAHQICLTREHIVVFNATLVLNTAALAQPLLARLHASARERVPARLRASLDRAWRSVEKRLQPPVPSPRCPVYVIARRDLRAALASGETKPRVAARRFELPGELTHALADHDDADGKITVFAQHNLGADPADQLEAGDKLTDGSTVERAFLGLFTAATDLNQVRRHVLDMRTGEVATRAFPDPADRATFKYGLNLLPPCQPLPYERASAPGLAGDLARAAARLDTTYWVAGGWLPQTAAERAFDNFRGAGHPRLVPEAEYRARVDDASNTVQLFALDRALALDSSFAFPPGWFVGAPTWVPKPGARSTREGWLVSPVWGPDAPHMEVWIFDTAASLARGPVCKLGPAPGEAGLRPGFPLHAGWIDREGIESWAPPARATPLRDVPGYVKVVELGIMATSIAARAAQQLLER